MDAKEYEKLNSSAKKQEDWMNAKWRPMMGWTYMATCLFDFILGPILYNILQYYNPGQAVGMWTPLTLQGGGLYHIAMGAIIGVSAYGRTQEKLNGANNGGAVVAAPVQVQQPVMMQQPVMATAPVPTAAPVGGSEYRVESPAPSADVTVKAGKKAPQQPDFPEI